jgi:hypothetical protein
MIKTYQIGKTYQGEKQKGESSSRCTLKPQWLPKGKGQMMEEKKEPKEGTMYSRGRK